MLPSVIYLCLCHGFRQGLLPFIALVLHFSCFDLIYFRLKCKLRVQIPIINNIISFIMRHPCECNGIHFSLVVLLCNLTFLHSQRAFGYILFCSNTSDGRIIFVCLDLDD